MAGLWKLPVVFVCENNFFAYSTPLERQMAIEEVADRAEGYGEYLKLFEKTPADSSGN